MSDNTTETPETAADWLTRHRNRRDEERRAWEERQEKINADLRAERARIKQAGFRIVANNGGITPELPAARRRQRCL